MTLIQLLMLQDINILDFDKWRYYRGRMLDLMHDLNVYIYDFEDYSIIYAR